MDVYLRSVGGNNAVAPQPKSAGAKPAAASTATVAVKPGVSDTSLSLDALKQGLAEVPVVDQRRVSEVSAALNGGHYQVDAHATAAKLVGLEKDLP